MFEMPYLHYLELISRFLDLDSRKCLLVTRSNISILLLDILTILFIMYNSIIGLQCKNPFGWASVQIEF